MGSEGRLGFAPRNTARSTAWLLALLVAVGGCSRHASAPTTLPATRPAAAEATQPAASATGVASATPAKVAPAVQEGAPQIVMSSDLVHIEYHVYGHGDPAVILIHGWSANERYWDAQVAALRDHYTVVTLDLAGHGASGRNRSEWTMARYGQDVAAVAHELSNARLILVGHAMGGPVALEAVPLIGPRVIGVIGVDTFRRVGLPPPSPRAVDQQVEPFRKDFIGTMHTFVPQLFTRHANPVLVRKVADDMSRAAPQMAIPSLISLNALDYSAVLPHVHVPIVAIDSDLGDPLDAARIQRVAPAFRAVVVKGEGNFLMLENPQRFNPILLHEIATLAAAPAAASAHEPPASR